MLITSMSLILVGIIIFNNRNLSKIFAYNEEKITEETHYYEYFGNSDDLRGRELKKADYDICSEIAGCEKSREMGYDYNVFASNSNRTINQSRNQLVPNIVLRGVKNRETTSGNVTVTYNLYENSSAAYACYSINGNSYESFESGRVFYEPGYYVIYVCNQYDNSYAIFSIASRDSGSFTYTIDGNNCYQTVTTTITTANSWNYVKVQTKSSWNFLPPYSYRQYNKIYINSVDNGDFSLCTSSAYQSTFSYGYGYLYEIYDYEGGNVLHSTVAYDNGNYLLSFPDNADLGTHNESASVITVDNGVEQVYQRYMYINHPMATDYAYNLVTYGYLRVVYFLADFTLTGYYYINGHNNGVTIGGYSGYDYHDIAGNPVIIFNGGNIFGYTNILQLSAGGLINTAFSIAGLAFSLGGLIILGSVLSIVGIIVGIVVTFGSDRYIELNHTKLYSAETYTAFIVTQ